MTDRRRAAVYAAESAVVGMVDRGLPVVFHGELLRAEPDRRFGRVADIPRYLMWVRDHEWGHPDIPEPTVRLRKGAAKATWESPGTIAVPDAVWARRELVVLHEYAHHVAWHTAAQIVPSHGPLFCRVFADLVRNAVGPSTGLLLTDAFYQADLFS